MKNKGYKLVILILLLICGILVVLLFESDKGKYCSPVVKAPLPLKEISK